MSTPDLDAFRGRRWPKDESAIPTPYEDMLERVLFTGNKKSDRTGTGTTSLPGLQVRYDLSQGFPLINTKEVNFDSIVYELLWFLAGGTNIRYLLQHKVRIWSEWPFEAWLKETGQPVPADKTSREWKDQLRAFEKRVLEDDEFSAQYGNLGQVYGAQWRAWPTTDGRKIDQIADLIDLVKNNPDSRRMIVTAWNPEFVPDAKLPPCHVMFQFYVADGKLTCILTQRSADLFLGVPFNIASYALLTMMIAQQAGLELGEFVWNGGDCHVYDNHQNQVLRQLEQEPHEYARVTLVRKPDDISGYTREDILLEGYEEGDHGPKIPAPVAV